MNAIPSPITVDVFVRTGPAEWWQILAALGPLAALLGAIPIAYTVWRVRRHRATAGRSLLEQQRQTCATALAQQTEADDRAEWWRRTQWALDRSLDDNEGARRLGLATLDALARSDLAREEDLKVLHAARGAVARAEGKRHDPGTGLDDGPRSGKHPGS
ncbi:hypothetical protein BMF89_00005 [Arthrobacter sp. SRS-W-1-2016]|uniref:hypothetical protein n=1 Tax=Arthrobacter sp. SRS-W-1-2016 TaxID=1930254 RepID=UPI0009914026|nr:hypothetical protein [Arthrobacter sp. SRS-W-1-2016]OOP65269.1 hypothetical protein BMF89_00005 [Arthrobacter sp. SRS-W-1-2016]